MKRLGGVLLGVSLGAASACGGQVAEDAPPIDGGAGFAGAFGSGGLPNGAVGGSTNTSGSAAATGGAASGGSGETGGSGGLVPTGGSGGSDGWLVGDACIVPGQLACAGSANPMLVQCQYGIWREYGVCQSGQNCDSLTGTCADLATECTGRQPNEVYCSWNGSIYQCGPDLVTREHVQGCSYCEVDHCICPPGTFGVDSGMTSCEPCLYGTFNPEQDAASCVPWTDCSGKLIETPGTTLVDQACGEPFRDVGALAAYALAVTPLDEVVVAGVVDSDSGSLDAFVQTHDDLGIATSTLQFGSTAVDAALALGLDAAGGRYVAGFTDGALAGLNVGGSDGFVRKYDAAGTEQWAKQIGSSGDDRIEAVALDDAGFVYVAGGVDSLSLGDVQPGDVLLRKYDLNGTEAWTRVFGTPTTDFALGVAVAPSGNVYVAGSTNGDLSGESAGEMDAFLRKYDADGALLWTQQFGGPNYDYGYAVAVDAAEAVYVVVQDPAAAPSARKFDQDGNEVWTRAIGVVSGDQVTEVALDADGYVYFGGSAFTSVGVDLWSSADVLVRKYTPSGDEVWSQRVDIGGSEQVYALVAGALGQVYVAGYSEVAMPSMGHAFVVEVWPP